jgi:hypothetical protein
VIAAAQSISIFWFPIILIPMALGYLCAVFQKKEERDDYAELLKRRVRRERELADELADALYFRGVKSVDERALMRYEEKRGMN